MDHRICRELAAEIAKIAERSPGEGWSLAAPASIHATIVDLLPLEIRERIVEHLKSDLVKIEPAKLPGTFSIASTNLIRTGASETVQT